MHGLDVAEKGTDLTDFNRCLNGWGPIPNLKADLDSGTGNHTPAQTKQPPPLIGKNEQIQVDSIGVGAGVYSSLKERGYNAVSIRVSEKPNLMKPSQKRFKANLKAQTWWQLRELFEHGKIGVPKENKKLLSQLSQMRYEINNQGKNQNHRSHH